MPSVAQEPAVQDKNQSWSLLRRHVPTAGEQLHGAAYGLARGAVGAVGGTVQGAGLALEKGAKFLGQDETPFSEDVQRLGKRISGSAEGLRPEKKEAAEGLGAELGSAIGSGLGFAGMSLLGGGALRLATFAPRTSAFIASGAQGVFAGGAQGYNDAVAFTGNEEAALVAYQQAVERGESAGDAALAFADVMEQTADMDVAWYAALINGAYGLTEAELGLVKGVARVLGRAERLTPNGLGRHLTKTMFEESFQEGSAQFVENLGAHLLKYDEDRALFEGVAKSAALGGLAGVVVGGGLEAAQGMLAAREAAEGSGAAKEPGTEPAGPSAPATIERAPEATQAVQSMLAEQGAGDVQLEPSPPVGEEEAEVAQSFAERGGQAVFVEPPTPTEGRAPLHPAFYHRPTRTAVFVRGGKPGDLRKRLRVHEMGHHLREVSREEAGKGRPDHWRTMADALRELDPEGFTAQEEAIRPAYEGLSPEAFEEEIVSTYLEDRGGLLFEGERFEKLARKPTLLRTAVDAIVRVLNRIPGIKLDTATDRALRALRDELAVHPTEQGMDPSRIPGIAATVRAAMDAIVGQPERIPTPSGTSERIPTPSGTSEHVSTPSGTSEHVSTPSGTSEHVSTPEVPAEAAQVPRPAENGTAPSIPALVAAAPAPSVREQRAATKKAAAAKAATAAALLRAGGKPAEAATFEAEVQRQSVPQRGETARRGVLSRQDAAREAFERGEEGGFAVDRKSPEFRRWFGDSKVVDEKGEPLVVYHGTPDARFVGGESAAFRTLGELAGQPDDRAFFFTASPATAATYANDRRAFDYQNATPGVLPVYLSIKNPLVIEHGGRHWHGTRDAVERARAGRHDGVVIRNVRDDYETTKRSRPTDVFAVFSSTQIKSATGNRGTFDPSNPDIRFALSHEDRARALETVRARATSEAPKAGAAASTRAERTIAANAVPTETRIEREIRRWQDSWRGVKTLQKHIAPKGIPEPLDTYEHEELRRGKTKRRLELFRKNDAVPLLAGLREAGITPEEFGEALMARHAPERNAVIRQRDPANDAGSGFTDDEAAAIMARIQKDKRAAGFARAFARYDALMQKVRAGWVKDGLESAATVTELEKAYKFYAPLRSDLSGDEDGNGTGIGIDTRKSEVKSATGRHTKAEAREVLAYAFTQAEQAIVRGEKNRVGMTFLSMLRAYGTALGDFAKIAPAQTTRAVVNGMVRTVHDPRFRLADNVFAVRENGEPVWIEINPAYQNVADGLKNLGAERAGALVRKMGSVTRFLSGLSTRYNPYFPLRNAIRDAAGLYVNSQEHGMAFAARSARDIPRALWALTKGKAGKSGGAKWDTYATEYVESGAPISFLDLRGLEDQLAAIEGEIKAQSGGAPAAVRRGWRRLLDAIDAANDVVENATRLSAYVHAREDLGMSTQKAASWAKNLTVNFERKGDAGATVNALYMFANAGVQSTARVAQAVKSPAVQRLLVGAFLFSMAWDAAMRALGGEDDDGEDFWDKIPPHIKRHNLVFMLPGQRGRMVTIPTPFVYDWIQTAGQQLGAAMAGETTHGKALGETLSAGVEAFDPIGGGQVDPGDPAALARLVSPTVLDPMVELATNRDWKGDPIGPSDYGGDKPDSERFWPDVSPAARAVTRWLNEATGGDNRAAGKIDVSPETIEHLTGFLTGGLGRALSQWADPTPRSSVSKAVAEAAPPLGRLAAPAVDIFVKESSPYASTTAMHDLQDALLVEKRRAADAKRPLHPALYKAWKTGNDLERRRQQRRDEIDALEGEAQAKAMRELDREIQLWNAATRRALLTATESP